MSGNAGDIEIDVVTATGTDDDGNPVSDFDDATVDITGTPSQIQVTKTANPTNVPEPGGSVQFTVRIDNTSNVDTVTINTLDDDVHGNLHTQGTCTVPQTIIPGSFYQCTFFANVTGNAGDFEIDTVTATGVDDDGDPVSGFDDARVDITDLPASMQVTKTANPTFVQEPGGTVVFTVRIDNTSQADSITISSLLDNIHGDLNGQGGCSVPQTIAAGGFYQCTFSATVSGNAGDIETDIVTATGTDDDGNPISDSDDATVDIIGVGSSIQVTKTANPTSVPEPGGPVNFTVRIDNTSSVDTVTINTLVDDIHGNLNGAGTCSVPQTILPGNIYQCNFTATVSGNAGDSETDVVTATGVDDDGDPVSDFDDATVDITDTPSSINVIKTASPLSVPEPGGNVSFTVQVQNTSSADTVTISSLIDSVYGNLNGKGTCSVPRTLVPGASFQCSFTEAVSGNAGDVEIDVVTATGTDDDGNPVSDSDDATVTITDLPSSIDVTKTANPTSIPEPGGLVNFTVRIDNSSQADSVNITSLVDNIHGNLNGRGSCSVPQTISAGSFYQCVFSATVSGNAGDSETDVVTAAGVDDDGDPVSDSDDARVDITNLPSSMQVTKTANPTFVQEPGGPVTSRFALKIPVRPIVLRFPRYLMIFTEI